MYILHRSTKRGRSYPHAHRAYRSPSNDLAALTCVRGYLDSRRDRPSLMNIYLAFRPDLLPINHVETSSPPQAQRWHEAHVREDATFTDEHTDLCEDVTRSHCLEHQCSRPSFNLRQISPCLAVTRPMKENQVSALLRYWYEKALIF